jgi:hypothetical protein
VGVLVPQLVGLAELRGRHSRWRPRVQGVVGQLTWMVAVVDALVFQGLVVW